MREKILAVLWNYGVSLPDICGDEPYSLDIHLCGNRGEQFIRDLQECLNS